MILLLDNLDSFTYNLAQTLAMLGAEVRVERGDSVTVGQVSRMSLEAIVISSGAGAPQTAGISVSLIRELSGTIPILGVSLGHQAVAAAFGASIAPAQRVMHGRVSQICHTGGELYAGLKNPFPAGRYHSLSVVRETLPAELVVEATAEDDAEIMALRHKQHATYGVQFHPESILTPSGKRLLRNFLTSLT